MSRLTNHRRPSSRRRSGFVALTLIVGMCVVLSVLAMAWNIVRLASMQQQLRQVCEASALAGAAELLDYQELRGLGDPLRCQLSARVRAQEIASRYAIEGQEVVIDANLSNAASGDVVCGLVREPQRVYDPLLIPFRGEAANTVLVSTGRTLVRGNPVTMWLGQSCGVLTSDIQVAARATVDSRICGFRPKGLTCVPMVPLVCNRDDWASALQQGLLPNVNDRFVVDHRSHTVSDGSDGLVEAELRAPLGDSGTVVGNNPQAVRMELLSLSGDDLDAQTLDRRMWYGLDRDDLAHFGGEFVIDVDHPAGLVCDTHATFDRDWINRGWGARGPVRIFPLGYKTSNESQQYVITGFGAGVIVNTFVDESTQPPQLVMRVQCAVLATSTAVTRNDVAPHPHLAKLFLSQ